MDVPDLHEQWCWEGDESILPLKWLGAVEACCGGVALGAAVAGSENAEMPRIWEAPDFDPEGIFFLTHRSDVCGTIAAVPFAAKGGEGGAAGDACGSDTGALRFWGVRPQAR